MDGTETGVVSTGSGERLVLARLFAGLAGRATGADEAASAADTAGLGAAGAGAGAVVRALVLVAEFIWIVVFCLDNASRGTRFPLLHRPCRDSGRAALNPRGEADKIFRRDLSRGARSPATGPHVQVLHEIRFSRARSGRAPAGALARGAR